MKASSTTSQFSRRKCIIWPKYFNDIILFSLCFLCKYYSVFLFSSYFPRSLLLCIFTLPNLQWIFFFAFIHSFFWHGTFLSSRFWRILFLTFSLRSKTILSACRVDLFQKYNKSKYAYDVGFIAFFSAKNSAKKCFLIKCFHRIFVRYSMCSTALFT